MDDMKHASPKGGARPVPFDPTQFAEIDPSFQVRKMLPFYASLCFIRIDPSSYSPPCYLREAVS